MTNKEFTDALATYSIGYDPAYTFTGWCTEQGTPFAELWDTCDYPKKMAEILGWCIEPRGEEEKRFVLLACKRARFCLGLVLTGKDKPKQAIELTEKWVRGEARPLESRRASDYAHEKAHGAPSKITHENYATRDASHSAVHVGLIATARNTTALCKHIYEALDHSHDALAAAANHALKRDAYTMITRGDQDVAKIIREEFGAEEVEKLLLAKIETFPRE
jgi:hypothetical protein